MDSIANLLTMIRNAEMAGHSSVHLAKSKINEAIVAILKENDYVNTIEVQDHTISVQLKNTTHSYKRISKPGRRMYTTAKNIPTVLGGRGMVIISTPEGVLSGKEAKKRKLGGELLCEVY